MTSISSGRSTESAKRVFLAAINAVQPECLIRATLLKNQDTLQFGKKHHHLNHNVYVVGFGKAVGGMCRVVQSILGEHIVAGVLSVPTGLLSDFLAQNKQNLLPIKDGKISVFEGAKNNLPDEQSLFAAQKIIEICESARENDLVIALISGGGSALLPAPVHPLTLTEKLEVIKQLTCKGATIQELNTVRTNLSMIKGGKLAEMIKPAKVWGLILSDIIGDPMHLIASGPTIPSTWNPDDAIKIFEKYGVQKELSEVCSVLKTLSTEKVGFTSTAHNHILNTVIGNNAIAIESAMNAALSFGFKSIMLSRGLCGEAKKLGEAFAELCELLLKKDGINQYSHLQLQRNFQNHGLAAKDAERLGSEIFHGGKIPLCIVAGGETTVTLSPSPGLGGRNQEMVLAFSIHFNQICTKSNLEMENFTVTFLSGGTDGQDGPTTAAGAVFCSEDLKSFDRNIAIKCLDEHNSNFYFDKYGGLLKTGLTGTNVMDIQILLIELKY